MIVTYYAVKMFERRCGGRDIKYVKKDSGHHYHGHCPISSNNDFYKKDGNGSRRVSVVRTSCSRRPSLNPSTEFE